MEETLGKRISKNRKRMGLTQDQLADRLGVTAQAVSKWENDQSCPDISTLPKLAAIFGITTDELLGSRPAVETTVEPACGEDEGSNIEINLGRSRKSGLGLALWLLLAGLVSLYINMRGREIPVWTVIWTSGLLTFGLFGLFPRFSPFRLGCALAGGYFLAGSIFELPGLGWPVVLIVLGILLLIRALQKRPDPVVRVHKHSHGSANRQRDALDMEGEHFTCETSFGERRCLVQLPTLRSGTADCSFGQLTVDLSGCGEIMDNAQVELSCAFGELILLVPSGCRVVSHVATTFGNFEVQGRPSEDADRVLTVSGDVNFGEGVVRYL